MDKNLEQRSKGSCELCEVEASLTEYSISEGVNQDPKQLVFLCSKCLENIKEENRNNEYFRFLNNSMWSEHRAVQILSYRLMSQIDESWTRALMEQMYLEEDEIRLALGGSLENSETKDSNGTLLYDGDSVTLIKDLVVKGAGFTAKRGTLVKNISLITNPLHIEGKVNGVKIVLVAAYLKRV